MEEKRDILDSVEKKEKEKNKKDDWNMEAEGDLNRFRKMNTDASVFLISIIIVVLAIFFVDLFL